MSRKRILPMLLAAAMGLMTLTGCGAASNPTEKAQEITEVQESAVEMKAGTIELRMTQASAKDGAIGISMDRFAALINERTDGRYVVNTFHNGQLGTERDNVEAVQMGSLDIAVVNQSVLGNFVPEISVFDLAYVFSDANHADRVFLGEIGDEFLGKLDTVGIKGLTIWESGFRNLTNSKVDVNSVDDVKGLRIRVMENQIHQELWRALGADPVPMAWSDAYTAMQQGAIDGQENPATVIDKNNVVEVNKHMAITEHCYATIFLIMSQATWNSLSEEDQIIFKEVAEEAGLAERTLNRQMDEEALKTLADNGMIITYPDKSGFVEASQTVRDNRGKEYAETFEKINALK